MTDELIKEAVAAQLYIINNPGCPLWHVLKEEIRKKWRQNADKFLKSSR